MREEELEEDIWQISNPMMSLMYTCSTNLEFLWAEVSPQEAPVLKHPKIWSSNRKISQLFLWKKKIRNQKTERIFLKIPSIKDPSFIRTATCWCGKSMSKRSEVSYKRRNWTKSMKMWGSSTWEWSKRKRANYCPLKNTKRKRTLKGWVSLKKFWNSYMGEPKTPKRYSKIWSDK